MAACSIVEKLNELIMTEHGCDDEQRVMYFLVQVRKLMERDGVLDDHKSIKFYCDWAVHPQKDRHHNDIDDVYALMYQSCKEYYLGDKTATDKVHDFMVFHNLRSDISLFVERYNINPDILRDSFWYPFAKNLLAILVDQPLVYDAGELITRIEITEKNDETYCLIITFKEPIVGKDKKPHSHYETLLAFRPLLK